ncbi:MAG: hypothetical protein U9N34_03655, partial [Candidatus Cloacimonadota bacterium]|nr:hypothetical protein [Candidatus Cloacimonadota bacterium]
MIKSQKNIFSQIVVNRILTVSVLLVVVVISFTFVEYKYFSDERDRSLKLASAYLSVSAVDPILGMLAYDRIPKLVNEIVTSNPFINYVRIFDITGNTVYSNNFDNPEISFKAFRELLQKCEDKYTIV